MEDERATSNHLAGDQHDGGGTDNSRDPDWVILAAMPYGGLHNNPPLVRVAIIASVMNAALWGGLVYSLKSLRDFLRGREP